MFRTILAATLSLGLALPTATPAQAGDAEDVAKIVGGIAAIYLLSRALEDRNDRNRREATPVRRAPTQTVRTTRPRHVDRFEHRRHEQVVTRTHRPHPRPHQHDRFRRDVRVIPEQCYRAFETRRGYVSGYGARCMQNAVARPGLLPPQCIHQVRTYRGIRNLYEPVCLQRLGWSPRTARR